MRHSHDGFERGHHHHGRGGEHHQRGGEHHGGGGRRQRFFGHGELRLVILEILTRNASHGYELIKEIETLTQGNYTPSPGVIYPTLDFLQDQQFITISEEENGRKKIAITVAGQHWLDENQEHLEHIQERVKARCVGFQLRKNPQMKRALDNFKAVLDLKVNQEGLSDAQLKQIIGIIDRASLDITQLD
ncbi:PadR family transcriptional regulator [Enterobacteriaceae bacterium 155047]|uniref:PadR family transcriptional regulator n=1 Tax=Huaxiibacter chinensis TaxID=2899785 RepID=UPI0007DA91B4|nr:PadR family transcriptional regulator [Huaxiibacter chinensis]ANG94239.1 PadR family transcriptional regulator [Lelliottia amnigena]MCG5044905.1 PadR family transcriptional regulator [Huaxiibacter chinensis]